MTPRGKMMCTFLFIVVSLGTDAWAATSLADLELQLPVPPPSSDLRQIPDTALVIRRHLEWLRVPLEQRSRSDRRRADLRKADLRGAKLSGVNLMGADLTDADLLGADLSGANLRGADMGNALLQNANLDAADLSGAKLRRANFAKARLNGAKLAGADLSYSDFHQSKLSKADLKTADLREAKFFQCNLVGASLNDAKLKGAEFFLCDLTDADLRTELAGARFVLVKMIRAKLSDVAGAALERSRMHFAELAPTSNQKLRADDWFAVSGIETMEIGRGYGRSTMYALRDELRKAGYRNEERAVTAALRRNEQTDALALEATFQRVAFDIPVEYGNAPGRALLILLGGIFVFAVPYASAIFYVVNRKPRRGGIWRIWTKDLQFTGRMRVADERLSRPLVASILWGLYFSFLSAFHIGWRELNVGSWIARIQPNEYTLRPTGWVRSVAGLQSLLSVYLVALWALSYFGRPFE
jgi:uncharacterized protein YjbI with pentapeptide repeats